MSDVVYLGRVKWVHESYEKNYRYATVEPLVKSSEDQKRWIGSIEDPVEEFPARGFVNWHDAPRGLEIDAIRQFELEPHPFYKGEPDKEAFQVKNSKYPMEIIDLREVGSERDIRILLTTDGVFLNNQPLVERCVLWVQDEKWVGPVNLIRRNATSSWALSTTQKLESIKCTKIPTEAIQQIEMEGTRYLLAPNQESLGQHIGFVNWEADEILAKRVLNRLLKRDSEEAKALGVSKKVFKTYVEKIEKAGLIGPTLDQELAFHERIKEIIDVISKNEELLDEAAKICFAIDPIKKKMEEKAEAEYKGKLAEHEMRLDEDLETKRAKLEDVVGKLSGKMEELSSAEERIQALNENLNERVLGFEAELEKKLRDLAEKPERLFAELAVTKALIPTAGSTHTKPRIALPRQIVGIDSDMQIVEGPTEFMGALSTRLLGLRISPVVGQALHSTLLAGLVPVLIGSEAYDIVSSYADCVAGGMIHWIPVGGSLFEPSDILARLDSISRCLVPHPGGLLDLLLDESDSMHIVVLDGFNRAAVDGYLIPLLQSVQDVARGRKPRSIPLAPPGFVSEDDEYSGVSSIAWSHKVLLVLCPSTGSSTLPLPAEFWNHCTALYTSDPAPVEITQEPCSNHRTTRVPTSVWKAWSESAKDECKPLDALRKYPEDADPLPPLVLGNIERICGSWLSLGLTQKIALEQALRTSLFPYLEATAGPVDTWLQHLKIERNEVDQKIDNAVKRLGE